MRRPNAILVAGALLLACITLSSSKGAPPLLAAADDPAVARGKTLFARVGCYECHGYAGQGGAAGPRIAARLPYAAFAAYVRHPSREMPPYTAKVLSDADLAAIFAYVSALPAPSSSAAAR
jgi:mono/diheme cytochrome c family protein